jgi:hypothetical protein
MDSIGNSSYNALQFTLRHPASHGLTVDVSYTFSKSLDLGSETERSNIFQRRRRLHQLRHPEHLEPQAQQGRLRL